MVVASLNSTSVVAAMASRFLNPLAMLCGAEAMEYPDDREQLQAVPAVARIFKGK